MRQRIEKPTLAHRSFRADVVELLQKHAGHLDAKDMLALSAHLVGQIIAMQDQQTVTREIALQIVMANIEQGNREVLDGLRANTGSA